MKIIKNANLTNDEKNPMPALQERLWEKAHLERYVRTIDKKLTVDGDSLILLAKIQVSLQYHY